MDKHNHFHITHYLILTVILLLAVVLFFLSTGVPDQQFTVGVATSAAYFIWGVVHHQLEGDLHAKIVVEYLLIALLAIFLLRGAIYRSI